MELSRKVFILVATNIISTLLLFTENVTLMRVSTIGYIITIILLFIISLHDIIISRR